MMLGFLLARMGVNVIVLEKHADFLRDFRGDTIHPSTLELMYELGLLQEFLKRPHQEISRISAQIGGQTVKVGDFTHLPTHCKMLAFMPQWDFLNFLVAQGQRYPGFHVEMQTQAVGLIEEGGRVVGLRARSNANEIEIRAVLSVGADGRSSIVREKASLPVMDIGAPMDVLWFQISRAATDPSQTLGHAGPGKVLVMLDREKYWQCGYVIAKGAFDEIRRSGIESFRSEIVEFQPFLRDRISELKTWDDVSLLTVKVDRLLKWWKPGLICIGDAAHAMSPVGGVGINLAIQDAVCGANILGRKVLENRLTDADLQAVQHRREFPTRATQKLQVVIQTRILSRVLKSSKPFGVPWPIKLMQVLPILRRIPARVIGIGSRPEHIHTPESPSALKH